MPPICRTIVLVPVFTSAPAMPSPSGPPLPNPSALAAGGPGGGGGGGFRLDPGRFRVICWEPNRGRPPGVRAEAPPPPLPGGGDSPIEIIRDIGDLFSFGLLPGGLEAQ